MCGELCREGWVLIESCESVEVVHGGREDVVCGGSGRVEVTDGGGGGGDV